MSKVSNDGVLLKEFNILVSDISKSVFDKTIYKDLKDVENNVVRILRENLKITEKRHRENIIKLEKGISSIVNTAIDDFNDNISKGEENFNNNIMKGIDKFTDSIKGASENLKLLEKNALSISNELEKNIIKTIDKLNSLTNDNAVSQITHLNNYLNTLDTTLGEYNELHLQHTNKIEIIEKEFKNDSIELIAAMGNLKNKMGSDREYLSRILDENNRAFKEDFKKISNTFIEEDKNLINNINNHFKVIQTYLDNVDSNISSLELKVDNLNKSILALSELKGESVEKVHNYIKSDDIAKIEEIFNRKIEKLSLYLISITAISSIILIGTIVFF